MTMLIAGGYAGTGARGLYPLDLTDGVLRVGDPIAPVVNVSAGVVVPGTRRWFVVDEAAGRIVALDAATGWQPSVSFGSGGIDPCHLALDASAGSLAVANYGDGAVALFRIDPDTGRPSGAPAIHRHRGSGPVKDRQAGPHAHWVGFDPAGRLYAVDLGADRILLFHPRQGALGEPVVAHVAPPGSGPRQLAFHPSRPVAYLLCELASTLTVLRVGGRGMLTAERTWPMLPVGTTVESLGGAIVLNDAGTRLHVSNRGHDSIATFALDASGDATPLGHVPTGGRSPRFLLVADGHLLVAHEQAGGVTLLPLDAGGIPQPPAGRADVPGACFLGLLSPRDGGQPG